MMDGDKGRDWNEWALHGADAGRAPIPAVCHGKQPSQRQYSVEASLALS